jgi:DNA-directed RNA polymerase specialized sigma subunit
MENGEKVLIGEDGKKVTEENLVGIRNAILEHRENLANVSEALRQLNEKNKKS